MNLQPDSVWRQTFGHVLKPETTKRNHRNELNETSETSETTETSKIVSKLGVFIEKWVLPLVACLYVNMTMETSTEI